MGLLDLFSNPQKAVESVATDAVNAGSNIITDIIYSPFRAIGGFAHGVWDSLWSGATYTLVFEGLKKFAPDLWYGIVKAVKGPEASAREAERIRRGGLTGELIDSAEDGFGLAAALGGFNGAMDAVGGGTIAKLGAGLVMAAVATVAIGAVHKEDGTVPEHDGHGIPPTPRADAGVKTDKTKG